MEYNLILQTKMGIISGSVETDLDFTETPFGFVEYRQFGSSNADLDTLNSFWDLVDSILNQNQISKEDFIRAIRVENGLVIFGEVGK